MIHTNNEKNEIVLHKLNVLSIFYRQLKNPLLIILCVATLVAYFLGEKNNSLVIFGMVLISIVLGFWNEYSAEKTITDLLKKVSLTTIVIRNHKKIEIPVRDVLLEDIVVLSVGSVVPADVKLIENHNIEVNESILTGESLPVSKKNGDYLYMGTLVTSGNGHGQVCAIGKNTKFGKISLDLAQTRPESEFQKGLRKFGTLLVRVIGIISVIIFVGNFLLGHSPVTSALFALSIAVGLTPELFPVIITVSLARGAQKLAQKKVVVKQLIAIEDLGNMEVLCTDKTGTLTEGEISLREFVNTKNEKDPNILHLGLACSPDITHGKGFSDAIDAALWKYTEENHIHHLREYTKIFEEPFNFIQKAMFVVSKQKDKVTYIYKGAPEVVLASCKKPSTHEALKKSFEEYNRKGFRTIAVATKQIPLKDKYSFQDAHDLEYQGLLIFADKPKKSAKAAIEKLRSLNVKTKILTGDNELTSIFICKELDLPHERYLLGDQLEKMTDEELEVQVWNTDLFARISPDQKVRVINALKSKGHTVGFLGDGINDGPALHAADVSISVNTAVDIAKDTATIVLLHKSLDVIAEGVKQGRWIFANTIKYVLMGTSSNFGNMISAAASSFVLPFLPMTPSQILLTNVLYDTSQLTIPTDNVDPEELITPKKWDMSLIVRYMTLFGPISTLFDFATFGIMLFVFHARDGLFQTGWFIESLLTEILVIFLIRTKRQPFFRSLPSTPLLITCLGVVIIGISLPFTPLATSFGLVVPPVQYFGLLLILTALYLSIVEFGKAKLINSKIL